VLPIRKWRESLRDLRRLEVEGAMVWGVVVVVVVGGEVVEMRQVRVRCSSWHVNVNVEAGERMEC
jgi:hypothetical protein